MSTSQWLKSLNLMSDWRTPRQSETGTEVGLNWQNSTFSAHPMFMADTPSVVGLQIPGGEMVPRSRFYKTEYGDPLDTGPDQPTAMSGWLTLRGNLSDWLTNNQTELKNLVKLQNQKYSISAHPLFMAVGTSVTGLNTLGHEMTVHSRFQYKEKYYLKQQTGAWRDYNMEELWDFLATDDGRPLCTDDSGEPLGITTGGGVRNQAMPHALTLGGGWW